ncbi:peroxiredoxin-like family protein [Leptobacterium sp. I13]|uniref:peroxiredoxin-like family protein n=1 Tax=Leptobacterium meishanense TaxID=3128904 RepID=UPI0030EE654B
MKYIHPILVILFIIVISCNTKEKKETTKNNIKNTALKKEVSTPDETLQQSANNIGDIAPDFTLKNAVGKEINLKKSLKNGPVIITWYRGGWCPYCNKYLAQLQEALPAFKEQGATLLALTPELPDKSITTSEKHQLGFEILSDIGNTVAKTYDIAYQLDVKTAEKYQNAFDLHAYNGDTSNELPYTATYVIGTDGIIKYAFLDTNYKKRAAPEDIIDALKAL